MLTLALKSERPTLVGYRYFWLKRVRGFNPAVHCARCLIGDYEKAVGPAMLAGDPRKIDAEPGEVFYLCGVSSPYRWEKNAHLAFVAEAGAVARLRLYSGGEVEIENARAIEFNDRAARRLFPDRSAAFLTCRNFQFGAQMFGG